MPNKRVRYFLETIIQCCFSQMDRKPKINSYWNISDLQLPKLFIHTVAGRSDWLTIHASMLIKQPRIFKDLKGRNLQEFSHARRNVRFSEHGIVKVIFNSCWQDPRQRDKNNLCIAFWRSNTNSILQTSCMTYWHIQYVKTFVSVCSPTTDVLKHQ